MENKVLLTIMDLQGSARAVDDKLDAYEIVRAHGAVMQDRNILFGIVQATVPADAGPSGISTKEDAHEQLAREAAYNQNFEVSMWQQNM